MRRLFKMILAVISHSAKGSEWDEHQYVKKVDGNYYYPDGYTKGRTISSLKENDKTRSTVDITKENLSKDDVEAAAMEVIRGRYGNGQERKDALGDNYRQIQDRVNQIMKTMGSAKIYNANESVVSEGEKAVKKATSTKTNVHSGVDMDRVMSVYEKRKKRGD